MVFLHLIALCCLVFLILFLVIKETGTGYVTIFLLSYVTCWDKRVLYYLNHWSQAVFSIIEGLQVSIPNTPTANPQISGEKVKKQDVFSSLTAISRSQSVGRSGRSKRSIRACKKYIQHTYSNGDGNLVLRLCGIIAKGNADQRGQACSGTKVE